MLTICHYTIGPGGKLRQPLPGDEKIRFNKWFTTSDCDHLVCAKSITLEAFKSCIKPCLPQYWQDFAPFLDRLIKATWNGYPYLEHPNVATHAAYRAILKEALEMYAQVDKNTPSVYAFVPSTKRPREFELASDQVRWQRFMPQNFDPLSRELPGSFFHGRCCSDVEFSLRLDPSSIEACKQPLAWLIHTLAQRIHIYFVCASDIENPRRIYVYGEDIVRKGFVEWF